MENTNNFRISEHFNLQEFECPCCKRVIVNKVFIEKLEQLRKLLGTPIEITSGYRCPEFNRRVKGHPFSLHTQGRAVDISGKNSDIVKKHIGKVGLTFYHNSQHKYYHIQLDEAKEW